MFVDTFRLFAPLADNPGNAHDKDSIRLGYMNGCLISANYLGTVDFAGGACGVVAIGNFCWATDNISNPFWRNLSNSKELATLIGNQSSNHNSLDQLTVSGHIITVPTLAVAPTVSTPNSNATASLETSTDQGGNDTAGRITLAVSSATAAGVQATLTFAGAFDVSTGHAPHVYLQPRNAATAGLASSVFSSSTGTSFTINTAATVPVGTYVWDYLVIQ